MAKGGLNRVNFTKRVLTGLPTPEKGDRKIYYDTGQKNLLLRVTHGAKYFFVQRKWRGRQIKVGIGYFPEITPIKARERTREILGQYAEGRDIAAENSAHRGEMNFGELWEDYRKNRARRREDSNSRTLEHQWEKHLAKWAPRNLSDLSREEVRRSILTLRKRVPINANRVQRQGKAMFNHAVQELGWKGANPFTFSQVSEKGRGRKRRVTHNELRRLFAAFEGLQNRTTADLFRMAIYTGQRIGNIKTMRFADVDLDGGLWRIPTTKQGEVHEAALPRLAIALLVRRQRETKNPWVFPGRMPTKPIREYKTAWRRALTLADIKNLTVHDLRHVTATEMANANVSMALIQSQLGHSDVATTAGYIQSAITPRRLALDAALAAALEIE